MSAFRIHIYMYMQSFNLNMLRMTWCSEDFKTTASQLWWFFFVVWVAATIAIVIISMVGLLGVAVVPLVQKSYYNQVLQFLVALAVGALTGDAMLHLLPHVSFVFLLMDHRIDKCCKLHVSAYLVGIALVMIAKKSIDRWWKVFDDSCRWNSQACIWPSSHFESYKEYFLKTTKYLHWQLTFIDFKKTVKQALCEESGWFAVGGCPCTVQSRLYQDNSSDTSIWEDGWQNEEHKVSGKVHVTLHEIKVIFVLLMTNFKDQQLWGEIRQLVGHSTWVLVSEWKQKMKC